MKSIRMGLLLLGICSFLWGCGQKTMTVADAVNQEGETNYIEIDQFILKGKQEEGDEENKVGQCIILIPEGYRQSEDVPGMYVHERYPLDSSNIYYTVSEQDNSIFDSLSEEKYREYMEETFQANGRQGVVFTVESFEKQDVEGFPAYEIRSFYEWEDMRIEQLVYLIVGDEIHTVTYSQAADDELIGDFSVIKGRVTLIRG